MKATDVKVLAVKGGVRMHELARALGMSYATFYRHIEEIPRKRIVEAISSLNAEAARGRTSAASKENPNHARIIPSSD